jgi:hypothetical protein
MQLISGSLSGVLLGSDDPMHSSTEEFSVGVVVLELSVVLEEAWPQFWGRTCWPSALKLG